MYKVLFVCLGNLCRSPTAEGIAKRLLKKRNLEDKIFVDSAGTNSALRTGNAPDSRAVDCADEHGIDLHEHKTRLLRVEDFAKFDLVLVMDEKSMKNLRMIRPPRDSKYKAEVQKILHYAPQHGVDVPDPYYDCSFDKAFEVLEDACNGLFDFIIANNQAK